MCDFCYEKDSSSSALDKSLKLERKKIQNNIRLLLLGIGGSGKSTIAKQLRIIYNNGFSSQELNDFKSLLRLNALKSMKTLVQCAKKENLTIPPDLTNEVEIFDKMNPLTVTLDESLVPMINKLWNCEAIQQSYEKCYNISVPSCGEYCFDNVERMAKADYVPNYADILQARQRTTGIVETPFKLDKYTFSIVDVGGQKSERRKWIHCFEGITALLYCVAMDEYDLTIPEEDDVNRMLQSVKVFETTANEHWFQETAVILFLNKDDLFKEKIKNVDLNVCFPEYKEGKNYESARSFIQQAFLSKNKNPQRPFYPHITVAINTENIRFVFNAVKDIIFSERLKMSGLMF